MRLTRISCRMSRKRGNAIEQVEIGADLQDGDRADACYRALRQWCCDRLEGGKDEAQKPVERGMKDE